MKISELFPGKYFKAADFAKPRTLTVESVSLVQFDDGSKPAVRFQGEQRQLVLNKTNSFVLVAAWGDDTDAWRGKSVEIFTRPVFVSGRQVEGIAVEPLGADTDEQFAFDRPPENPKPSARSAERISTRPGQLSDKTRLRAPRASYEDDE
jgi:hypothetical protein